MRNLITIALLFLGVAAQAQIPINTNFKVSTPNPIDGRMTIPTLADTSTITDLYDGLLTVVEDTDEIWQYNGTVWTAFSGGGEKFERILYVAENVTDGDGSFSKPYGNLWEAKDSAKAGDLVYVINGTHVIDTLGSGADKEIADASDLTDISLVKDGVNYYLSPNVRIENNAKDSTVHLFYDTLGQTTNMYGHGTLAVGYNTTSAGLIFLNDSLSNVNIQCDSILWSDKADPVGWIRSGNLMNYQTAYFDVRYYEPKNSYFIVVNNDLANGDTTRNARFRFDVDVLNANGADYTFRIFRTSPMENCDVQVNIGYAYGDLPYQLVEFSGGGGNDNHITINIDKANFASSRFGMIMTSTRFTGGSNNTFHVHCNDCYSTDKLIRFEDFNSGGENNTYTVSGYYRSRDEEVVRLRYPTEATLSDGLTLTLDGTFVSDSSVVVSNQTRSLQLIMRGRYETLSDNSVLNVTRTNFVGSIDLDAATLIQPENATTNPIESSTVGTVVSTFNSSANSDRQSANVTYEYNKELGINAKAIPYENAETPDSNTIAAGMNDLYDKIVPDTLIRQYKLDLSSTADTIQNLATYVFDAITDQAVADRIVAALEVNTTDTVGTDFFFIIQNQDLTPVLPSLTDAYELPQGESTRRFYAGTAPMTSTSLSFNTGDIPRLVVSNGSAVPGIPSYVASEGTNEIFITIYYVDP
jgi:hypothetical protein